MTFEQKYLKYKDKYLNLKKTLENSGVNFIKDLNSETNYSLNLKSLSEFHLNTLTEDNHKTSSNKLLESVHNENNQNGGNEVSDLELSYTEQNQKGGDSISDLESSYTEQNQKGGDSVSDLESSYTEQKNMDLSSLILSDVTDTTGGAYSNPQPAIVSYPNVNNTANCSPVNPAPNITPPQAVLNLKNYHSNEEINTTTELVTERADIDILLGQLGGGDIDISDSMSSIFDSSSSIENMSDFDSSPSLSDL